MMEMVTTFEFKYKETEREPESIKRQKITSEETSKGCL